jgi:hypothetical protein
MNLEESARKATQALLTDAGRARRPSTVELKKQQANTNRPLVTALMMLGAAAVIGGVALSGGDAPESLNLLPPEPNPPAATATAPLPDAATTVAPVVVAATPRWSIAYPSDWTRADSDLMPNLGWRSLTLATFPIRSGESQCAHMPTNALQDLGPEDSLISIFAAGQSALSGAGLWPETGFDDTVFPAAARGGTGAQVCADRPDLEVHWGAWELAGEGLYVLVAFGADVDAEQRTQTWNVLSSLDNNGRDAVDHGFCVVTRPTLTGFVPSASYPAVPPLSDSKPYPSSPATPGNLWYGDSALWTALHVDGDSGRRKDVWWSSDFQGGTEEPRPDITVTYERIDIDLPTVREAERGTNAFTEGDGWFMIAGIDSNEPGCWQVTAEYRDATLSYVFQVP